MDLPNFTIIMNYVYYVGSFLRPLWVGFKLTLFYVGVCLILHRLETLQFYVQLRMVTRTLFHSLSKLGPTWTYRIMYVTESYYEVHTT